MATDGSDTAAVAVRHAVELGRRVGARVTAATVHADEPTGRARQIALALLRDVEAEHGAALARLVPLPGDIVAALLGEVVRGGHDLLVVGNRGMAGQRLANTVPNRLTHRSPVSVLLVDSVAGREPEYRRIVVGTDGSASAARAVHAAVELGAALEAEVSVAVVAGSPSSASGLAATVRAASPGLDVVELVGDPAAALCDLAESRPYDLLVVANRGMTGARRFLGSVPDRVTHRARTSVLLVRTAA